MTKDLIPTDNSIGMPFSSFLLPDKGYETEILWRLNILYLFVVYVSCLNFFEKNCCDYSRRYRTGIIIK